MFTRDDLISLLHAKRTGPARPLGALQAARRSLPLVRPLDPDEGRHRYAQRAATINAEDLREWVRRQPFEPFALYLTDGTVYQVHHREMALVTRRTITLGVLAHPDDNVPDRSTTVSLLHVVRVEPLSGGATSRGNGPNGGAGPVA